MYDLIIRQTGNAQRQYQTAEESINEAGFLLDNVSSDIDSYFLVHHIRLSVDTEDSRYTRQHS